MDAQRWLRELRAELTRSKLPPFYVERLVVELSDHLTDCMEDRMSTDAKDLHGVFDRLGAPGQVAASAAKEYRKARFSRRHPVLMFVVLPIVSLPLLWAGSILGIVLMVNLLDIRTGSQAVGGTAWHLVNACLPYVVVGLLLLPAATSAVFFTRLAQGHGRLEMDAGRESAHRLPRRTGSRRRDAADGYGPGPLHVRPVAEPAPVRFAGAAVPVAAFDRPVGHLAAIGIPQPPARRLIVRRRPVRRMGATGGFCHPCACAERPFKLTTRRSPARSSTSASPHWHAADRSAPQNRTPRGPRSAPADCRWPPATTPSTRRSRRPRRHRPA